ncbi:transporter substrate-binding domain-containing protein [Terasakiella sp. A23]|uniref:substrate-binding periplasmic protein n=1 Tax=Terasakiella sp. FCG-A23 TaxID=3080561 RepID=UPI002954585E|nr:transporter substrate-binding domain-containing protein [Terasakiella sp. A23]MDV7338201.1 transporter substrate-binding domain-containing protein [Terasakiella sp. A23]
MSTMAHAIDLTVKVGFSHFPPWQIAQKGKLIGGVDKHVLDAWTDELSKNHNIQLTLDYYHCPLKRCLAMLENGMLDIKTGLLRHPEREWYVYYVTPAYQEYVSKAIYVHKDFPNDIETYEDLKFLTIGVPRAAANFAKFDQDDLIRKVEVNNTANGLKMLEAKRFQAFMGTELVTDYFISKHKLRGDLKKAVFKHHEANPGFIGISKKSKLAVHLPQLRTAMKTIVDKGLVKLAVDQVMFSP